VDDLHARRAASFGYAATEYALHRPDYPDQAVAWALASMLSSGPNGGPVLDGPVLDGRVLDLGAGTGKLTTAILRCGMATTQVLAVEPDDGMRAELRRRLPEITILNGSAEQIPAEEGAVDAVLVGQAFHWFDLDRALSETARVLRPGGVLAAMGNIEDDSVGWVAELSETAQAARPIGSPGRGFADVPQHPAFGEPEQREFCWRWPRTIDSFLATVSTHSWALVSRPEERAAALAAIRRFLEQHPATRNGAFEVPMRTLVQRMVRHA
jgi:SAM-dependent methyltransferase